MIVDLDELKVAAEKAGTTLENLCAEAGVHSTTLWRWKEGKFSPRLGSLKAINRALEKRAS